jgi:hypothetical protein
LDTAKVEVEVALIREVAVSVVGKKQGWKG